MTLFQGIGNFIFHLVENFRIIFGIITLELYLILFLILLYLISFLFLELSLFLENSINFSMIVGMITISDPK